MWFHNVNPICFLIQIDTIRIRRAVYWRTYLRQERWISKRWTKKRILRLGTIRRNAYSMWPILRTKKKAKRRRQRSLQTRKVSHREYRSRRHPTKRLMRSSPRRKVVNCWSPKARRATRWQRRILRKWKIKSRNRKNYWRNRPNCKWWSWIWRNRRCNFGRSRLIRSSFWRVRATVTRSRWAPRNPCR